MQGETTSRVEFRVFEDFAEFERIVRIPPGGDGREITCSFGEARRAAGDAETYADVPVRIQKRTVIETPWEDVTDMSSPVVLDAKGKRLEVGSKVHSTKPYADALEVIEIDSLYVGTRHLANQTFERFPISLGQANHLELIPLREGGLSDGD